MNRRIFLKRLSTLATAIVVNPHVELFDKELLEESIKQQDYASGFSVTNELMEDDIYNILAKQVHYQMMKSLNRANTAFFDTIFALPVDSNDKPLA